MSRRLVVVLGGLVIAVGALLWWWGGRSGEGAVPPEAAGVAAAPDGAERDLAPQKESGIQLADSGTTAGRELALPRLFAVSGAPLAGATITRVRLPDDPRDLRQVAARTPLGVDWESVRAQSTATATDDDGRFDPAALGELGTGERAAYWIEHERHEATVVVPLEGAAVDGWPALPDAEPSVLIVLDADREPVAGAEIGVFHARGAIDAAVDPAHAAALRLLRRDCVTDEHGQALATWSGHDGVARASTQGAVSRWTPLARGARTELVLEPSFALRVDVRAKGAVELGPDAVLSAWTEGSERLSLASQPVKRFGAQPPLHLPRVDAQRLVVSVDGTGFAAAQQALALPAAGSTADVVLELEVGVELLFRITDAGDAPLADAEVALQWGEEQRTGGGQRTSAVTDDAGRAALRVPEAGPFAGQAKRSGYRTLPFQIVLPHDELIEIALQPGAGVRGRLVDADGEPVREAFRVLHWRQDDPPGTEGEWFPAGDGRFELTNVPVGDVELLARAAGAAPATPVVVRVPPEGRDDVELVLPRAIAVTGRAVDALSGAPLAGAAIYQSAATSGRLVETIGQVATSDADGRFTFAGANAALTGLGIVAAGYGDRWTVESDLAGPTADLGTFALFPRRDLTVRLVHAGDVDPTRYRTWISLGDERAPVAFDAAGAAVLEDVRFGWQIVTLQAPSGAVLDQQILLSDLDPAEPWEAVFEVTGRSLLVTIMADGEPLPADLGLQAVFRSGPAHRTFAGARIERTDERLEARFDEVPARGELGLEVYDNRTWDVLAQTTIDLASQSEVELALDELGDRRLAVEVVDADGRPLPGTEVCVMTAGTDHAWQPLVRADEHGVARFALTGLERVLVHVFDRTVGHRHGIEVALKAGQNRVRVALDDLAPLEVVLRDAAEPVEAVRAVLFHASHPVSVGVATSDADGRLRFERLSADSYRVSIRHPNLWPVDAVLAHAPSSAPHDVQVRHLASVDLRLLTAAGAPLANHPIELRSVELDADVATWLASGAVTGELRTDPSGRLQLEGLPRGPYTLNAPSLAAKFEPLELTAGPNESTRTAIE